MFSLDSASEIEKDSKAFQRLTSDVAPASADTTSVPEIIDPVFAKTSQNARFLLSENERFGLVFVKTGSINSGTGKESKAILCTLFSK